MLCRRCTLTTRNHVADGVTTDLAKRFCLYTGQFAQVDDISLKHVLKSFGIETLGIVANGAYTGVFAPATILGRSINSVYPDKGPIVIRADLYRRTLLHVCRSREVVNVMWTSTRYSETTDMSLSRRITLCLYWSRTVMITHLVTSPNRQR